MYRVGNLIGVYLRGLSTLAHDMDMTMRLIADDVQGIRNFNRVSHDHPRLPHAHTQATRSPCYKTVHATVNPCFCQTVFVNKTFHLSVSPIQTGGRQLDRNLPSERGHRARAAAHAAARASDDSDDISLGFMASGINYQKRPK